MSEFDNMVEFLDLAWPVKDQVVPCLIGPVGIGKTAAVMQHAENVGAGKVVTIIASQVLPSEVSGITMPDKDTKVMDIYDHARLASLEDGDILFFDELLEADQMVLKACLTLIESRQMMSGRKLPDIQIIAATNPTISPGMLQENIRQRFLFKQFGIDQEGCKLYIEKEYGFTVPETVLSRLEVNNHDYNILSQRSLTKMVHWVSSAEDKPEAQRIGNMIDQVWHNGIGSAIADAYIRSKFGGIEYKMRSALRDALVDCVSDYKGTPAYNVVMDEGAFQHYSLEEFMDLLKSLPEWSDIEAYLSNISMEEEEDTIAF